MRMCALRACVLCSWGNGVRLLWAFFFEKAPLSSVPFLKRIWIIICPQRLGSGRCWGSEEPEIVGITDGACWRVWERSYGCFSICILQRSCIINRVQNVSSKEAWQDQSPREHNSVLCVLGIEKQTISRVGQRLTRVNCWSRMIIVTYIIWSSRKCSAGTKLGWVLSGFLSLENYYAEASALQSSS